MSFLSNAGRRSIKATFLLLVVSIALISIWCVRSWAQAEPECPVPLVKSPDAAPFYGEKTCPIVGHIGNVKLAIPQNYILGPVAYKGVDIWNAESYKNRPKHPTLDTEIDNFAIRIRLNNFRPIESRKDVEDYDKLGKASGWKQPPENRWIYVGFKTDEARAKGFTQKTTLENWISDKVFEGPFTKAPSIWNLDHYISKQKTVLPLALEQTEQYEVFFDPKEEVTFINCQNLHVKGRLPSDQLAGCRMNFSIPDLKIFVDIQSVDFKDDLARWPEIQKSIRQLIQSFVVQ